MKSIAVIGSVGFWCYVLLLGAWMLDLFTPQLFIAAIFLNVPRFELPFSRRAFDAAFDRPAAGFDLMNES